MKTPWLVYLRFSARHPAARSGAAAAVGTLLLSGVIAAIHWAPSVGVEASLLQQLDHARRERVAAALRADLTAAYERAASAVPHIEAKLARRMTQAEILGLLTRQLRAHGLGDADLSAEELTLGEVQVVATSVGVEGSYASLRAFLVGLPSLPVLLQVDELRLESLKSAPGRVRAQLRMRAFRSPAADTP